MAIIWADIFLKNVSANRSITLAVIPKKIDVTIGGSGAFKNRFYVKT
jgi:hypothetical protein